MVEAACVALLERAHDFRIEELFVGQGGPLERIRRKLTNAEAPEKLEWFTTEGGRRAEVIDERGRGWYEVKLDGNANDEGDAFEIKVIRPPPLTGIQSRARKSRATDDRTVPSTNRGKVSPRPEAKSRIRCICCNAETGVPRQEAWLGHVAALPEDPGGGWHRCENRGQFDGCTPEKLERWRRLFLIANASRHNPDRRRSDQQ